MEKSYLIALIVAAAVVLILFFMSRGPWRAAKPELDAAAAEAPRSSAEAPRGPEYTFYPKLQSYSPYFGIRTDLANNVPALKALCESTPGCVGFNTNGRMYKSLDSQATWVPWNGPDGCGIYVRNL